MERSTKSQRVSMQPPADLAATQEWFAKTISTPLQEDNKLQHDVGAEEYITPNHMSSQQRIEIYHQQYWWRLLTILQENFPLLVRVLGVHAFNDEIAIPYLTQNPSRHFAICTLGDKLVDWLESPFLSDCARIDWASKEALWIEAREAVDFASYPAAEIPVLKVTLQPYIYLFALHADLFAFREEALKSEGELPKIEEGECYYILFRDGEQNIGYKKISVGEHFLLSKLKQGMSIQEACEELEMEGGEALEDAQALMPLWFRGWIDSGWIVV